MFDFRLKVFYTVAKRQSFTKAAQALYISQPAVTKHIRELEQQLGTALFNRAGNHIELTSTGNILLQHTEAIFAQYRSLEFDLNQLKESHGGSLEIGASTTIAQYVIPPLMAAFHAKNPQVQQSLLNGNTEQIEEALLQKSIQLGIVEGMSKHPAIKYTEFMRDEIVLVTNAAFAKQLKLPLTAATILQLPILLREQGSGTLQVIADALLQIGIKMSQLNVPVKMGATESIKSYLHEAPAAAFLSLQSVQREIASGEFVVLPVKQWKMMRKFYFIQLQGEQDKLATMFMRFLKKSKTNDES
ncbi:DNA-binding transcriptional LysR family regulator [Chitinophaga skermanii]|uniref:DNA-binding transcriptional LysR family regulator n=1 Tax=Chitinophaga skermanii TaxID=331697 RepID=A0A327PZI8_9BACT|nr:LysR substrate-binding domain-containing protein [Chitinophaga skermanii]RAI97449.1 DNA-binding transcriptional LysR family regulator [Chitinophaga skermanii]